MTAKLKSKVIVIFPLYNGEKSIRESLECIARQTFKDFRAVVVENHSTDNSKAIAEEFAKTDNRFEVIQNDVHTEAIQSFCAAFTKFQGQAEYLCFRAHDDLSADNYLEELLNALDEEPEKQFAFTDSIQTLNGEFLRRKGHDPRVIDFRKNLKMNKAPRRMSFPADAFYGLCRSGVGTEIFIRRLPELGTPWCAASYVLAEYVARDLIIHVGSTHFEKRLGSASRKLYGTIPVLPRIKRRYKYAKGIWDLKKFLAPLTIRQYLKLLEIAWRDAKKKTGYYIVGI